MSVPEHTTTDVYELFVSVAIDTLGSFPSTPQDYAHVFAIICCFFSFMELIPSFDNTDVSADHALLQVFGRYDACY